jgi:hypothetical protein
MSCMRAYQGTIAHASIRLPCGIYGGLFQEDHALYISLQDEILRHYLQVTQTSPDACAVTDNRLSVCVTTQTSFSVGPFINFPRIIKLVERVVLANQKSISGIRVISLFLTFVTGFSLEEFREIFSQPPTLSKVCFGASF